MVAWPLAGGQYSCELASEGTHLLDDGRPPLFVFVCVGGPPLCCCCAVFSTVNRHVGAIHVCHLPFTFIVIRSCSYSFIVRFVCWYHQPSQGGGGKFSSVMNYQGAGEVAGRGLLTGVLPLSSWVHPSSRVIVIGSSLSNPRCCCRICFVIKSVLWLLW